MLLTYKRYVHKKGKKHGPYYYKNVRDESGKVKSVYLGKAATRGKKPLEVMIVFLVALIIIISALFFIQNRNLVLSKVASEESQIPFEVDQILIKVLVKADEYIEKQLRVMNVDDTDKTIAVDVSGLFDVVDVLDKEFTIKPGQTKIVRLNFSSFDEELGLEQAPGVYIGKVSVKTDSYQKQVPVVIEIESKNVLFDMNLNPVARDRKVLQGSGTTFEIRVFNLQSIDSFNIDLEFFVKDINGNTIISESESVVVQTQASFFKTLKIPEKLKTGNYVFVAQASFGDSIGTASYMFYVGEAIKEKTAADFIGFCRNDPLCWTLSIVILLLIFTIGAYTYFFIGVLIYRKLFGVRAPKTKEESMAEPVAQEKGENPIISSFRNLGKAIEKDRETRIKKKLELKKQKLMLREMEERLKKERQAEKLERAGLVGKCRSLIDKGYKALDKNNRKKADNIYLKLMDKYINLPSERKAEIFKEINSFYKSLVLKKRQFKQAEDKKEEAELKKEKEFERKKEGERKLREEIEKLKKVEKKKEEKKKRAFEFFHGLGLVKSEKEQREIEKGKDEERKQKELKRKNREENARKSEEERKRKKLEDDRQREVERKRREDEGRKRNLEEEKLRERKLRLKEQEAEEKRQEKEKGQRERKRRIFNFFHGLGLVKTEEEEEEKRREKRRRELKRRRREEQKRKQKELEEKQKEAERKNREEKEEKAKVGKEHDLEKSLKELGEIFEQNKKKKPGIIKRFIRKEKKITPEAKVKKEIKENRQGKSRTFAKCHQLLLKADDALQKNDVSTAKKFYSKTRNLYIGLEYMEKKEIYKELMSLYNNLSKGKK